MWEQPIDANGHTIPITYLGKDGKQYVAIMAGGGGGYFGGTPSDSVIAFALGEHRAPAAVTSPAPNGTRTVPGRPAIPAVLPDGPGKAVVQRTCGGPCHSMDTVTGVRRDRAAWVAMVDNMVARGATAKESEIKMIVDYLARYFGK